MQVSFYIVDENSLPIPFVNVYVSASPTIGTASDVNGLVVLDNDQINSLTQITMSYLGRKTTTALVTEINNTTVTLEEETGMLDEVVVSNKPKKFCWLCVITVVGTIAIASSIKDKKETK